MICNGNLMAMEGIDRFQTTGSSLSQFKTSVCPGPVHMSDRLEFVYETNVQMFRCVAMGMGILCLVDNCPVVGKDTICKSLLFESKSFTWQTTECLQLISLPFAKFPGRS